MEDLLVFTLRTVLLGSKEDCGEIDTSSTSKPSQRSGTKSDAVEAFSETLTGFRSTLKSQQSAQHITHKQSKKIAMLNQTNILLGTSRDIGVKRVELRRYFNGHIEKVKFVIRELDV